MRWHFLAHRAALQLLLPAGLQPRAGEARVNFHILFLRVCPCIWALARVRATAVAVTTVLAEGSSRSACGSKGHTQPAMFLPQQLISPGCGRTASFHAVRLAVRGHTRHAGDTHGQPLCCPLSSSTGSPTPPDCGGGRSGRVAAEPPALPVLHGGLLCQRTRPAAEWSPLGTQRHHVASPA